VNSSTAALIATVGGFAVALATFVWALFARQDARMDRMEDRFDRMETRLGDRIGGVEVRLGRVEADVSELKGRVDEQSSLLRQVLAAIIPQRAA
jgi:hypothetical protein